MVMVLLRRDKHCIKNVHIQSFSSPYFPAFGLNTEIYGDLRCKSPYSSWMWGATDQKNSEYGYFLRSEGCISVWAISSFCSYSDVLLVIFVFRSKKLEMFSNIARGSNGDYTLDCHDNFPASLSCGMSITLLLLAEFWEERR